MKNKVKPIVPHIRDNKAWSNMLDKSTQRHEEIPVEMTLSGPVGAALMSAFSMLHPELNDPNTEIPMDMFLGDMAGSCSTISEEQAEIEALMKGYTVKHDNKLKFCQIDMAQ